jgi:hypothetical protein
MAKKDSRNSRLGKAYTEPEERDSFSLRDYTPPAPATLADAPADGKIYARRNGAWVVIDARLMPAKRVYKGGGVSPEKENPAD